MENKIGIHLKPHGTLREIHLCERGLLMKNVTSKSILIGNGININFGGKAYTNNYIIKRILFNARASRYDPLFNGEISGDEIASIFVGLATWANAISDGKYDAIIPAEEKPILEDFKARYNWKLSHYYEVGLEDWLFILHVYFLKNADIADNWSSARQGFERMMLDAIYNDGDIQNLYKVMGRPVKRWLLEFSNVFTLNYDNNVEDLIKRPVFHLHGDFRTPANSENPQTLMGYIRRTGGENIDIPHHFEHCFCDALFDYAGEHKYDIARAFEKGAEGLLSLEKSGIPSMFFPAPIEELLKVHKEHPELTFGSSYHFTKFRALAGELHIIGMSPNNDAHIFKLIDESNIEKVVFYYFSDGEAKKGLPVHQKVEYESAKELWKRLGASPKQYNCKYAIPQSGEVKKFFEVFNLMSGDKVSEADIIKSANSIPQFEAARLCKIVMEEMKTQQEHGAPKDEKEQQRQFREISRIALRNGILPSALYLHVIMGMNASK
jgi:hypothetical protein